MSPNDDDPSDRDAILARRALLLSTALAAFSCGSPRDQSPQPEQPATGTTTATATASASSAPNVSLPAPLPAWKDTMAKAPPLDIPASVDGKERDQLGWLEKRAAEQYEAIRGLWEAVPRCDATLPDCRPSWRKAGEQLKAILDLTRVRGFGGCGGANGETATVVRRRSAHDRYQQALLADLQAHVRKTAAAFGPLAEQEWLKLEANANKVPPMPCLSPCPMPEVQSLLGHVPFSKNASKVGPDEPLMKSSLDAMVQIYKGNRAKSKIVVRGHASPSEDKPAELAAARAKAVADWLVKAGIPKDSVVTKSFGAELPIERADSDLASENQRVDFEAVPQ